MITIGIDPGLNNGVAMWNNSFNEFMRVDTLPFWDLIALLEGQSGYSDFQVRLEYPQKNKPTFSRSTSAKGMNRISRNVGSNFRTAELIAEWLKDHGVTHELVKPTKTKWDAKTCRAITGYEGRTNEHTRDAIRLAYKASKIHDHNNNALRRD